MIHYLQISKMRGKLAKLHTVASLLYDSAQAHVSWWWWTTIYKTRWSNCLLSPKTAEMIRVVWCQLTLLVLIVYRVAATGLVS